MPRIPRAVRAIVGLGMAALALTGCANKDVLKGASGHSTHTVRMTVTSSIFETTMSYRVGKAAPRSAGSLVPPACITSTTSTACKAASPAAGRFAATTVSIRSGQHLTLVGGVPGGKMTVSGTGALPSSDSFTCSISVDGVVRTATTASAPIGAPVPTCTAEGYIGSRPFQVTRLLEYLAVAFCLLVVIAGIALQFSPHRGRD